MSKRQKRVVKIIAIVLAAVMVMSVFFSMIWILISMKEQEEYNKQIEDLRNQMLAQQTEAAE